MHAKLHHRAACWQATEREIHQSRAWHAHWPFVELQMALLKALVATSE